MSEDTAFSIKTQVWPEYALVKADVNRQELYLEFSLRANYAFPSIIQYLTKSKNTQEFLIQVLKQWRNIIKQIELAHVSRQNLVIVTKKLQLRYLSEDFKQAWKQAGKDDAEYNGVKYELSYCIAFYSDRLEDVKPFIEEVTAKSNQKNQNVPAGLDLEKQVVSVLYKDTAHKEIKRALLHNEDVYDEVIKWFRKRLYIIEIYKLISQKRKYNRWRKKECHKLLRLYKQEKKRGSRQDIQISLSNALKMCSNNITVFYLAKKWGVVPRKKNMTSDHLVISQEQRVEEKKKFSDVLKKFSDVLFSLRSYQILTLLGFCILLLFYAIPRVIKLVAQTLNNVGTLGNMLSTILFSQLLLLIVYGFLAYLLFKSLTEPVVSEPLRTGLALAFISYVLPITNNLWTTVIDLSDNQFSAVILAVVLIGGFFFYRDSYRETLKLTQSSSEALKRTCYMVGIIVGQALIYALMASDFFGRFNFPGISPSPDLKKLAQDYLWNVMPKLIVLSIGTDFHIYVFPPVVILLTLTPFVLLTLQSGVVTVQSAFIKLDD
jgi:hypothetical protein